MNAANAGHQDFPLTLGEYFQTWAKFGDATAFVRRTGLRREVWSYKRLLDNSRQFARELEARGIEPGDRVGIWAESSPHWAVAFWGTLLRGAVAVPMDAIAAPDFALRVFRQTQAKLIALGASARPFAEAGRSLALDDLSRYLERHSQERYPTPAALPDDTAEIIFTSGATSEPKGVAVSHRNLLANLKPLAREINRYRHAERWVHPLRFLCTVPLSHVFGQFMGMFVPPLLGATTVVMPPLNPSEVIRIIRQERVSVLIAVPRLLQSLASHVQRDSPAGGSVNWDEEVRRAEGKHFLRRWWRFRRIHQRLGWRFLAVISGGAALDEETERFWTALGYAVIQGYGMTETASLISVNHPFRLGRGSLGKTLPGIDVKLDPSGEILVKGENIARYFHAAEGFEPAADLDGWLHTGDLGEMDGEGRLYFRGRKKDVLVTAEGLKIFPQDLEAALRRQPEVRDCVVFGMKRSGSETPCAVLLLNDNSKTGEEIVRRANTQLAPFQRIQTSWVWPELDFPRTGTQKPRMAVIRAAFEAFLTQAAGQAGGAARVYARAAAEAPSREATMGDTLANALMELKGAPPPAMRPEMRLGEDLNLGSFDRLELLEKLENQYQISLDESQFTAATTIADLEKLTRQAATGTKGKATRFIYPDWAGRWPFTWLRFILYYSVVSPFRAVLGKPRVLGDEKLWRQKGPVLVIANHVTMVDPAYVLAGLPCHLRHKLSIAMDGELLMSMRFPPPEIGFWRARLQQIEFFLITLIFNVFPLPQQAAFRESFNFAANAVERGISLLVFPEGVRTPDGRIGSFRTGIGILARDLGIPVVPVLLRNLYQAKISGKRYAPSGAIQVIVGAPVRFASGKPPEAIAADLRQHLAALEQQQLPGS